jgi:hypothetical protein
MIAAIVDLTEIEQQSFSWLKYLAQFGPCDF